jgi:exosortase
MSLMEARKALQLLPREARLGLLAVAALLWVYWPTLAGLREEWDSRSQYSHGYLVPLFSGLLCWSRRGLVPAGPWRPSWWGLPVLTGGFALHFGGSYAYVDWLVAISLLPCLAGIILLAGGGPALRWAWPGVAFLLFMVPLPYRVAHALGGPLQRLGTVASTFVLQTLGFFAFAEGTVIHLGESRIGVVEACSGLSMLFTFFALSTAVALVVPRPPLEKLLLFVSAVPIALLANIARIVVTAVLHKTAGSDWADLVFHDLAGWLMMPLALGMLWGEFALLSWLLLAPQPREKRLAPLVGEHGSGRGGQRRAGSASPLASKGPTRDSAPAVPADQGGALLTGESKA